MKGQGESIIEDDDKGEDPDVVTDNPGEILFHYETQLPNNETSLQISLLSFLSALFKLLRYQAFY